MIWIVDHVKSEYKIQLDTGEREGGIMLFWNSKKGEKKLYYKKIINFPMKVIFVNCFSFWDEWYR